MTDINERVEEEWKREATSRERVKEVLGTTAEYQSVSQIAERALVSQPTARKYLEELAEEGLAVTSQEGRATRYRRDEGRLIDRRIDELRTTHSHQELLDGIREMTEEIQGFRETYGVDRPEDLAVTLESGDDGWGDLGRWRATRRNLALAKAALQVDEAHRLAEA